MIQAWASEPFGVAPQSAEAPAKPTMPMYTMRRGPMTSASRPPRAKVAASASRYAFTTHCEPAWVSDSSDWMFGDAIATIVWSMNVMATAKSMAARARFFIRDDGCPAPSR